MGKRINFYPKELKSNKKPQLAFALSTTINLIVLKYLVTLSICLASLFSNATEVVIQGKIANFENRQIRAYIYEDYITFTKEKIASTPINDGHFQLKFNLEEIEQVVLTIEDKSTVIYAEPGKVYNIALSYDEKANSSKIYDKFLNINFPFPTTDGLNQLISAFNNDFETFFEKNYRKIFVNRARKEVETFVDSIRTVKRYKQHPFVRDYILYVTANLLDISGTASDILIDEYLNGNKIAYSNPEYMNFFRQLFDEAFRQFAISSEGAEMRKALMLENNVDKALTIIQKGQNIQSVELAELFLLDGLYGDFYIKTIDQKSNLRSLEYISKNGKTEGNRIIAKNILHQLKLTKSGSKAPNFVLKNIEGKSVGLADFKGKYIYLNFWSSWSVPSIKELNVMKNIHPEYKDKIEFISINLDEKPHQMKELMEKNRYPWTFLHYGDDYELKEKYNVRTVPSYFLIGPNGNFVESPAPSPLQIEDLLKEIN